jgi:dipeptidyl aminopeptidase/acylaminoacyl peptidase
MRPEQLGDYRTPSDARIHPDGAQVAFVVTQMDLEADRYVRRIWLWDGEVARPLTAGPADVAPRWSPDGTQLAFLRKAEDDKSKPQLAILPLSGGEAECITDFSLGVSEIAWSPNGSRVAVVAAQWIDSLADLDDEERARRPRRVTTLPYRFDNQGWVGDRRQHIYLVDPSGEAGPVCLTPGDFNEAEIVWNPDGTEIAFSSAHHETRGFDAGAQIWTVPVDGGDLTARCNVGYWGVPSYDLSGQLYVIGRENRWSFPDVMPLCRLRSDGTAESLYTELDRNLLALAPPLSPGGPQWLENGSAYSTLEDSGRIRVVRLNPDGSVGDVIGGDRMITGVSPRPDGSAFAFTATEPTDPGELFWYEDGVERRLTHLNDDFRQDATLAPAQRFVIEHEGVEVEGWIYLPPGESSVPALFNLHGGPATQYGYGFFDEFQVYAGAGYGVLGINPRGSSGYGSAHVRAVVGRWQEENPPDLRDLVAAPSAAAAVAPRLDLDRMGVMGGSYGGMMTVRLAAVDHRYKSAVAERGLYSWLSFGGTSDIGPWFDRMYLDAQLPEAVDLLWQASALAHADRVVAPTLIVHSEGDYRCPIEQAEQLFVLLRRVGTETEMVRFPAGEGHELSRSGKPKLRKERFEIILDWHDRYLA